MTASQKLRLWTVASVLVLALAVRALAADLTLEWDAPSNGLSCQPPLTYRLYTGTTGVSRVYHSVSNVGQLLSCVVTSRIGTTVYAVTAVDGYGDESKFSDELTITRVRPQKPTLTKYTITTKP